MPDRGLRTRKKAQTRQRIADVAANLFAERGYDAVSMVEVARAAEVSDQTVYNYFAAKHDLVLDRAEQVRGRYSQAIGDRGAEITPARALETLLLADIQRYEHADLDEARGTFITQCVASPALRRFALEEREHQVRVIAEAIKSTSSVLPAIVAHAHAAALVAVIQVLHDQIGRSVLDQAAQPAIATELRTTLETAVTSLDSSFTDLIKHHGHPPH
jgi:AcrR family transcriptional regulator